MLTGLIVFAALIGFINEHITSYMNALKDGSSRVLEDKHTLILGWNESTARVVAQICFLRRVETMSNEEKLPILLYFPSLLRVFRSLGWVERPSSSMSANNIVIMCKDKTKEEMHIALRNAMSESGIKRRTKIGSNIICRVGDPTDVNDLLRVAVQRASAILVQVTPLDRVKEELTLGKMRNGATCKVALSVRNAVLSHSPLVQDLRIVLQMSHPSEYIDAVGFRGEKGNEVLIPLDLSRFLNSLLFKSAVTPGLANVLMELFDFEGLAIRRRRAKDLRGGPSNEYGHSCGMGSANGVAQTLREMQSQYDTAAFIGMLRPSVTDLELIKSEGLGLCCDPDTLIQPEDLLIYIGRKPTPRKAADTLDCMSEYRRHALELLPTVKPEQKLSRLKLQNTLICGWRDVWEENPERFKNRVRQFTGIGSPSSCSTFINNVALDRFEALMAKIGIFPAFLSADPTPLNHNCECRLYQFSNDLVKDVYIRHIVGDAAEPSTLSPVVLDGNIHSTIVLGTQSSQMLPIEAQDTRVLSIMLLLRKLCAQKKDRAPMHVIGENQQDITARLALVPTAPGDVTRPDFINTQAIYARVLCLTMAYPTARFALADLFTEAEGSANLELKPAANYVPLNEDIPFGVVRQLCSLKPGERTVCIGCQRNKDITLMPHHKTRWVFEKNDNLVLIRRHLLKKSIKTSN